MLRLFSTRGHIWSPENSLCKEWKLQFLRQWERETSLCCCINLRFRRICSSKSCIFLCCLTNSTHVGDWKYPGVFGMNSVSQNLPCHHQIQRTITFFCCLRHRNLSLLTMREKRLDSVSLQPSAAEFLMNRSAVWGWDEQTDITVLVCICTTCDRGLCGRHMLVLPVCVRTLVSSQCCCAEPSHNSVFVSACVGVLCMC